MGSNHVAAGSNHVAAGSNRVAAGSNHVAAGSNHVAAGSNHVAAGTHVLYVCTLVYSRARWYVCALPSSRHSLTCHTCHTCPYYPGQAHEVVMNKEHRSKSGWHTPTPHLPTPLPPTHPDRRVRWS
eukprot:365646-Chlamydomonas_euryale.AAC.7